MKQQWKGNQKQKKIDHAPERKYEKSKKAKAKELNQNKHSLPLTKIKFVHITFIYAWILLSVR